MSIHAVDSISSYSAPAAVEKGKGKKPLSSVTPQYENFYGSSSIAKASGTDLYARGVSPDHLFGASSSSQKENNVSSNPIDLLYLAVQKGMMYGDYNEKRIQGLLQKQEENIIGKLNKLSELINAINSERKIGEKEEKDSVDLSKNEQFKALFDEVRAKHPSIASEGKYVFKGKEIDALISNLNREVEKVSTDNKTIMMMVQKHYEDGNAIYKIVEDIIKRMNDLTSKILGRVVR